MEQKQQSSISEEQIWEKIEEMGGFEELAQKEEFFKCERDWWEAPKAALESIKDPSPDVKTALEICMAVLEYSKGNFGYQPKDLTVRILSSNMRRVIKTSLEERVKQKAKNALAGKASAEKRKKASTEESQHKPAREDTSQHVLPQEHTSQQESARANHITITEQNRTETETETEEELKERKKYKPTTTTNSSSGKFSLSVSKAIETMERYNVKSFNFATQALMNDREETGLTPEEEFLAAALHFLTGKTESNVSRIANLMDEAVSKGAREHDIIREVYRLAMQASGQENDFKDRQKCQTLTGTIVNYLKNLVEEQSRRAAQERVWAERTQPTLATPPRLATLPRPQQAAEQPQQATEQPQQPQRLQGMPVEETQPTLATPQQQETEQPRQSQQPQQATEQPQQETEQPKPSRLAVVPQAKFSVGQQSQLSLSVSKTIELMTDNGGDTFLNAFPVIKNSDIQKTLAALYFLTDKSQSEVSEITGLIDEVVNTGARREENILKEVFDMAIDASNGCLFDDRNGCRETADKIKNHLKGLLAKTQSGTRIYIDPNEKLPF